MNKLRHVREQVADAREAVHALAGSILDAKECTRYVRGMCKRSAAHMRRRILAALPVKGSPAEIEAELLSVVDKALTELAAKGR